MTKQIKIVMLKQKPLPKNVYQTHFLDNQFIEKINGNIGPSKSIAINSSSIAYLSSILQDQNSLELDSKKQGFFTQDLSIAQTLNVSLSSNSTKIRRFRNTRKSIQTDKHLNQVVRHRSDSEKIQRITNKTIDKIIHQRKLFPIDKLKPYRKNINLSQKNKEELTSQFTNFVHNQKSKEIEPTHVQNDLSIKLNHQKKNHNLSDKLVSLKMEKQRHRQNKLIKIKSKFISQPETNQGNNTCQKRYREPLKSRQQKIALSIKKITKNFDIIENFEWSKVKNKCSSVEREKGNFEMPFFKQK